MISLPVRKTAIHCTDEDHNEPLYYISFWVLWLQATDTDAG